MRLIDADLTRDEVSQYITTWKCKDCLKGGGEQFVMAVDDIAYLPTVDAEPVKHARWVKTGRTNGYGDTEYKCLNCQSVIYVPDDSMIVREKYCFNCGCKMTLKDGESK